MPILYNLSFTLFQKSKSLLLDRRTVRT